MLKSYFLPQRKAYFRGGTARLSDLVWIQRRLRIDSNDIEENTIGDCHQIISEHLRNNHVFSYGAARMGLYEVLRALGVNRNDEVIVPGFTCAVVVNAIRFCGAIPKYADIELSTLGAHPNQIEKLITPRTKAIIIHHMFGIPCDIEGSIQVAKQRNIPVIEDVAMGLGGQFKGQLLGTFSDASIYSTERTKMISTVNGGILATNDEQLAQSLEQRYRSLSIRSRRETNLALNAWSLDYFKKSPLLGHHYGKVIRQIRKIRITRGLPKAFECESFQAKELYEDEYQGIRHNGYPWRIRSDQLLLMIRQLRRLGEQIEHRTELATELLEVMKQKGVGIPSIDEHTMQPAWLRFPFWVEERELWRKKLESAGIECGYWFEAPVHPKESCDNPAFSYVSGSCPNAEWLSERILNIPITPRVSSWMIKRIRKL